MTTLYQTMPLYPEILWERPVHQYKAQAGRILVIAGSRGSQAEALLTCEAIFRSGTGILTLAFPEELKGIYAGILPDAMTLALPQTHSGSIAKKAKGLIIEQLKANDTVLLGPGLSTNTETVQLIWELLPNIKKTLVIGGDGVQALTYGIDAIRGKGGIEKVHEYFQGLQSRIFIIATPGEAGHLLAALGLDQIGTKPKDIQEHKERAAELLANNLGATIIIAGQDTVIANGKRLVINKVGQLNNNPSTEEGVLSGITTSFLAQNPTKRFKATTTAVYLYAIANATASKELGKEQVTPNEVIRYLPQAIKKTDSES